MRRVEWPTVAVALVIYVGFAAITLGHAYVEWWVFAGVAGYLLAWHGSLQHEVIHGHPTPWQRVNALVAFPCLWLWLPFGIYRDTHVEHHRTPGLTLPGDDPESFYVTSGRWRGMSAVQRCFNHARRCLVGRMLLEPFVLVAVLYRDAVMRFARGDTEHLRFWLLHAVSVAMVLVWVIGVCGIPLTEYLLFAVYPSLALTAMRTFAEHQAAPDSQSRTTVVETSWPVSLVFLNNNLHAVHHREPGLPWYRIPGCYRRLIEQSELSTAKTPLFRGYIELLWRYGLLPREPVVHPRA